MQQLFCHSRSASRPQTAAQLFTTANSHTLGHRRLPAASAHIAAAASTPSNTTTATAKSSSPNSQPAAAKTPKRRLGPGLPLAQGLRAVGAASNLVGWQVVLAGHQHRHRQQLQHETVGTVTRVESVQAEGGPAYDLLRVEQPAVLQPYGFKGTEVHLLPLVPDIIAAVHPQQRLLVATPPDGLLDLGRRGLLLSFLAQELLPYAPTPAAQVSSTRARGQTAAAAAAGLMAGGRALTQMREMPTRAALVAAGRNDLVNLILKVGGFTQAALQLGLRASRRPAGYWESLEILDIEVDAFIAGCWVALPCPDEDDDEGEQEMHDSANTQTSSRQQQPSQQQQQREQKQEHVYFFNTATRSIVWQLPDDLQALAGHTASGAAAGAENTDAAAAAGGGGDVSGGGVLSPSAYQSLLDLQEERVMPSSSSIMAAGRWDLHQAITSHGGYRAVAAELERRPYKGLPDELLTTKGLRNALKDVCMQEGWGRGTMPTAQQLLDVDRQDLIRAISHMGGWKAAAQSLNLHNRRPTPHAWRDWSLDDLAQQLAHFMAAPQQQQQQPQQQALTAVPEVSMQRRRSSRRSHTQTSSQGSNQITRSDPLPVRQQHQDMQQQSHLPTQAQLMSAGRFDLVYSLRQYGYEAVRQHMGLQSRWRKPKIKGSLQWEAVEAAVAAGCYSCVDILQYISTNHQRQQQQQIEPHTQQQQQQLVVPLVSRDHLQRQLKAWVDEGRLVKAARNCFKLPADELCCGRQ